jgi:thiol-disulfide isomerase/thioredoxin
MGRKKSIWMVALAVAGLLWGGLQFWRSFSHNSAPLEPLAMGSILPGQVELIGVSDSLVLRAGDLRGKVVLLNFWAEWCAPCIREMPTLVRLHETFEKRGLVVVGISMDEKPSLALEKLKGHLGTPPPFFMAKGFDSIISAFFSLEGLPFTAILDREGKLRFAEPGFKDWMDPAAQKIVEGLL